jgi:hypothetical protein
MMLPVQPSSKEKGEASTACTAGATAVVEGDTFSAQNLIFDRLEEYLQYQIENSRI